MDGESNGGGAVGASLPIPAPRGDLVVSAMVDAAIVLDRVDSRAHLLNASAAWIWDLLDGDRRVADVVDAIVEETGLEAEHVAPGVVAVIEQFAEAELLGEARPLPVRAADDDRDASAVGDGLTELVRTSSLGFTVAIDTNAPDRAGVLVEHLALLRSTATPSARYALLEVPSERRWRVVAGEQLLVEASDVGRAIDVLLVDLNRRAIERIRDRLLFHAGAVVLDGAAVVLPATSGSGKSTLTAALVAQGGSYLTDEATALDPRSLAVEPYPKPIALSPASIDGLADAGVVVERLRDRPAPAVKHHVAPSWIGRSASAPAPVRALVFPTFVPGAETTLEPLSAGEALVALVPCSFAGTWFVDGALDRVVDLAEHVPAYRLTFGDLARATRLIREAVGSSAGPR